MREQVLARYGQDAYDFVATNKLRKNKFTFINTQLWAKIEIFRRKSQPTLLSEKLWSIRERYSSVVKGYDDMEVDEKIATAKKLDELFIEVLGLFK